MNVLILGSGGREHAIAYKISQSKKLNKLYIAQGNAGTKNLGTNIPLDINNFNSIKKICLEKQINLVIVGPENPLVNGIYDFFIKDKKLQKIKIFGPSKQAAKLEGSKEFAKKFLIKHNIPTAKYKSFNKKTLQQGLKFLETLKPPYVLKADGLAAGKGVVILSDLQKAKNELYDILTNQKFGNAGNKVVIEEFLNGIELSCFVVTDGNSYKILPFAKDYKRILENDKGLNTGGMGAVSPVTFIDKSFYTKIEETIIKPTINGLKKDKLTYKGVIFIGLIKVNNNPFVIEYNVRFGDPETEVVLPKIDSDVLELFLAVTNKNLEKYTLKINPKTAVTVMLVSKGYPEKYEKNKEITGLNSISDSIVFHAGTKHNKNTTLTNGGRVVAITSFGKNISEARKKSYQNIDKIKFKGKTFRKDIGLDIL